MNRIYQSEIPPKIIFNKMKENSYDFFLKNIKPNINIIIEDYFRVRNSLIELLKNISNKLNFKSQTFFLSIYYLDIIVLENNKTFIFKNYQSLALGCLVIASKYCENDQNVPQLPYFIRLYNTLVDNKSRIAISDLMYNEVKICKILKYNLHYYTIYDYNSFLFGHGILKIDQLKEIKRDKNISFSLFVKKILEKIYKKSRNYLDIIINKKISFKYNSLLISIYIMQKSVESVILNEFKVNNDIEKIQIKKKSNKYFKDIMNNYYEIDYESLDEYQLLKSEIEPYRNRNKNIVPNVNSSLDFNKNLINYLTIKKINENMSYYNLDTNTENYLSLYQNNNDFLFEKHFRNSVNLSELIQKKFTPEKNTLLPKQNTNKIMNINNGKLINAEMQRSDYNYSLNTNSNNIKDNIDPIINFNRKRFYNIGIKRILSSNKYLQNRSLYNINNENNLIYYNNFTNNNLASSINLDSKKLNIINRSIDISKSISPKYNELMNITSKDSINIIKNKPINRFTNSKINNKTQMNMIKKNDLLNVYNKISNDLKKTSNNQIINNNKSYLKKILYNNIGDRILSSSQDKKIKNKNRSGLKNLKKINNTNYEIKLSNRKKLGIANIKERINNYNSNSRHGNLFFSLNNGDNDNKDEINVTNNLDNIGNRYLSSNNNIKKKVNLKIKPTVRNNSNNNDKILIISPHNDYQVSKISLINNVEEKKSESIPKKNNINLKNNKNNLKLYSNNNIFKRKGDYYINTDINSDIISNIKYDINNNILGPKQSTLIKSKNIIRTKSKESQNNNGIMSAKNKQSLIQSKYSDKKQNIIDSNRKNLSKKSNYKEFNNITFIKNGKNNNLDAHSNNNIKKNKKFIKNNKLNSKNKSKLIVNNNNNSSNKFDNEIISLNNKKLLKKNGKLNYNDSIDIIVKRRNHKKQKILKIDDISNNNTFENKNYLLYSSNNQKSKNKAIIRNDLTNNKSLFSTIVINNNNININLNKKINSKENTNNNVIKNDNSSIKDFCRNNENNFYKRINAYNNTTDKIKRKNLKRIKTNKY